MFAKQMSQYVDNLDALRDFVALIGPFLKEHFTKQMEGDAAKLLPLALIIEKLRPDAAPLDPEGREVLEKRFAGKLTIKGDKDKGLTLEFSDTAIGQDFKAALERLTKSISNTRHLYRSSLINLISTVEWFLASLLHAYYGKFKDAIGGKDKQFSLNDLKSLGSIEDATNLLIGQKVEDVLRASFEDWVVYLRETLKLSMAYLGDDMATLTECFQRRNLLVHNNGVVNTVYLAKVPADHRKRLKVGMSIPIEESYVDKSIRTFERVFLLIAAELWKKIDPKDKERGDCLIDLGFRQLKREHWETAEGIYTVLMQDKAQQEVLRMIAQVNYWQCLKWQGRLADCKQEIMDSDLSAKDNVFELARAALLDEEKEFFELLPSLLKTKKLSRDSLFDWPLFREMRKSRSFQKKYGKQYVSWLAKATDDADDRRTAAAAKGKNGSNSPA